MLICFIKKPDTAIVNFDSRPGGILVFEYPAPGRCTIAVNSYSFNRSGSGSGNRAATISTGRVSSILRAKAFTIDTIFQAGPAPGKERI